MKLAAWIFGAALAPAAWAQGVPSLFSATPNSAPAGTQGTFITVSGANFNTASALWWNNTPLPTSFVSPNQLNATVAAGLLAAPGTASLAVVNLGGGRSAQTIAFTITQSVTIGQNALPAATATVAFQFTFTASGGTQPYSWLALEALPPGLTLSANGVLSGTPTTPGTYTFTVRASDGNQSIALRTVALTVALPPVAVATASLPAAAVGITYTQTLAATGGTPPYTWAATGLPAGVALDRTGVLSGTPALKGNYRINVQVSDSKGDVGSKTLPLVVNAPPLTIATESPLFDAVVGTAYAQTFAAAGGTPPYTWSVVSGSLGDLTLDATRGTLSGTPQSAGQLSFVIQVGDSAGVSTTRSFLVNATLPRLTIVTVAGLAAGRVGVAYQQALTASGGIAPYTWSVDSGIPPGLAMESSTGLISGTPLAPGSFTFNAQASDSRGQTASKAFTVTVSASSLTLAVPRQFPDAVVGRAYGFTATASGGQGRYSWSANGLPEGLRLDSETGSLSGTPTTPGAYAFTLRVTDDARATALDLVRLNVSMPEMPAPVFSSLPGVIGPATQQTVSLRIEQPYATAVTGQLQLSFSPDKGAGDGTIQFSTGGRTADFTIPAGETEASLPAGFALQSGTVAGTLRLTAVFKALGADVGPSGGLSSSMRIEPAAPVIRSARLVASANGVEVRVTGYSTPRELTEIKFRFTAASGSALQTGEFTVPIDSATASWFSNPDNASYGSQFTFTQPFGVQGTASAVTLQSVTLSNRYGSTTFEVRP